MPGDARGGPLEFIWIFEYHEGLCRYCLGEVLRLLTQEVLLKEIDLVVLTDALGS